MAKFGKKSKQSTFKPMDGDGRVQYYHSKYHKYARAIGFMWAVLVVCFLIVVIVCLAQPAWIGTSIDEAGRGHFGLYSYYVQVQDSSSEGTVLQQRGEFLDFEQIPSDSFKAATVFMGLTVLLTIVCVICLFLFLCLSAKTVFLICGWMLAIDAVMIFLACVIYPGGWDAEVVRLLCNSDSYNKGDCVVQWAYILAMIAIFDAIILAILAFVLAFKRVKLLPWQDNDDYKKSQAGPYIIQDDRGSNIRYVERTPQPVIVVDQRSDRSQPIGTLRSHKSSKHNFNL